MTELEMTSALGLTPTLTIDLDSEACATMRGLAHLDHQSALDRGIDPSTIDPATEIDAWQRATHYGESRECRDAIRVLGLPRATSVYATELATLPGTAVDLGPSATEIEAAAALVRDMAREDHDTALDIGDDPADIDPEAEVAAWALTVHAGDRACREAIAILGQAEAVRVYAAELATLTGPGKDRPDDDPSISAECTAELHRGADEEPGFRDFRVTLTVDDVVTSGCVTLALDPAQPSCLTATWAPSIDYWADWVLVAALDALGGHDRRRAIAEIEAACQDLAERLDGGAA